MPSDEVGFVEAVAEFEQFDSIPVRIVCDERLRFAMAVVCNQTVGRLQNESGAAEVLLQPDNPGVGKLGFEAEDVLDLCSTPTVNGLIGIAGDAQIRMVLCQRGDNAVLSQIGVLVLIDQYISIAIVQISPKFPVLGQQHNHVQQQIVEIDGIGLQQTLLIGGVDSRDDGPRMIANGLFEGTRIGFGGLQFRFRSADASGDLCRRIMDAIDVQFVQHVANHLQLVGLVIDREVGLQPDETRTSAQQQGTKLVEGAYPNTVAA